MNTWLISRGSRLSRSRRRESMQKPRVKGLPSVPLTFNILSIIDSRLDHPPSRVTKPHYFTPREPPAGIRSRNYLLLSEACDSASVKPARRIRLLSLRAVPSALLPL
jgi:hypothetical protein